MELRSKGPGRKGIPPISKTILGSIYYFRIYFYIGYEGLWEKLDQSCEIPWSEVPLYMKQSRHRGKTNEFREKQFHARERVRVGDSKSSGIITARKCRESKLFTSNVVLETQAAEFFA